jgi:hypothetical protein
MNIGRLPDAGADRMKVTMSGKFLPDRYHGVSGDKQALGCTEE